MTPVDLVERQLVTIIAEAILERRLRHDLRRVGARGYSLTRAEGQGTRGLHAADWEGPNIRVETVVTDDVAQGIFDLLAAEYFADYAVVAFTSTVRVARPAKFDADT